MYFDFEKYQARALYLAAPSAPPPLPSASVVNYREASHVDDIRFVQEAERIAKKNAIEAEKRRLAVRLYLCLRLC